MKKNNIDRQSIELAVNGNENARVSLLNYLSEFFTSIGARRVNRRLQSKVGQSDVYQNALFRVSQNLSSFQGTTEEELTAWASQILTNEFLQVERNYSTQKRDIKLELQSSEGEPAGAVDPCLTPSTSADQNEQWRSVLNAVSMLSKDHQRVIELRMWHKLSFSEIGVEMNRSESAANKLWCRALLKLEENLPPGFKTKTLDEPN